MSIEVDSISKHFGDAVALDDVSLEVPTGSLTALLGPSGGGKSTLLRIIAGLDTADTGTVRIEGQDLTNTPARSRGVGFCFQHYAPFRHLTVRRNVAFGLEIRRRPKADIKARVDELLDLVGLAHLGERYPSQLSGGQRQRMALARALAIEPKVLLLDEPFGALDAQVRTQLRQWLRDLHDTLHVTTVLVTHDQEEAMEVADRLAIINHGRLEQVGTPSDMYDHPANEFVLTFLGPATRLNGEWVRPHDLAIHPLGDGRPPDGALTGTVTRVTHLGFEVKVDVALVDAEDCWVQLSRGTAADLHLEPGQRVWVVPSPSPQPVVGWVGVEPSEFNRSNPSGVLSNPGAVPATSGTP
ncbi:MAG TPA: TOBE-like domain-containing protein [Acidimicrobiales bacterium]|jgi:sulfate transport system ATP-binding protein|nr:TOBE-like domain-containing protein [Acidimicrobiales bacterium]